MKKAIVLYNVKEEETRNKITRDKEKMGKIRNIMETIRKDDAEE